MTEAASIMPTAVEANAMTTWLARCFALLSAPPSLSSDGAGEIETTPEQAVDEPPSGEAAAEPSADTDAFGRSPGDEHYGHDHPSQGAAGAPSPTPVPAPAPGGGADSFGRQPGSEHYGHNHP